MGKVIYDRKYLSPVFIHVRIFTFMDQDTNNRIGIPIPDV